MLKGMLDPFALALLRDRLSSILFPKLYIWIREKLVKPKRPDVKFLQSNRAVAGRRLLPGEAEPAVFSIRLMPGSGLPRKILASVANKVDDIIWFALRILQTQRVPWMLELTPELETQLTMRSTTFYNGMIAQDMERGTIRNSTSLRIEAIRAAFREFNLDPDHYMEDIVELAEEVGSSRASTPEPGDMPLLEDFLVDPGMAGQEQPIDVPEIPVVLMPPSPEHDVVHESPSFAPAEQLVENSNPLPIPEEAEFDIPLPTVETQDPSPEMLTLRPLQVEDGVENTTDPIVENAVTNSTDPAIEEPPSRPSISVEDTLALFTRSSPSTPTPSPSPIFQPAFPDTNLLPDPDLDPLNPDPLTTTIPQIPPTPSPPLPGITRAPLLFFNPAAQPRPLRRPTISDQPIPSVSGNIDSSDHVDQHNHHHNNNHTNNNQNRHHRHHHRRGAQTDPPHPQGPSPSSADLYRVTILSNHPAESLAYHAATLLETIILLPLDILFMRSLAWNFLARQSSAVRSSSLVLGDLQSTLFPRDLSFWGNIVITLVMQGLVNSAVWVVGTGITLRLGREFGWGKI